MGVFCAKSAKSSPTALYITGKPCVTNKSFLFLLSKPHTARYAAQAKRVFQLKWDVSSWKYIYFFDSQIPKENKGHSGWISLRVVSIIVFCCLIVPKAFKKL